MSELIAETAFESLLKADARMPLPGEDAARGAWPPRNRVTRIRAASRSTARWRASLSGWVKSGEQHSMGISNPAADRASPTVAR